jgi:hypothetical protein
MASSRALYDVATLASRELDRVKDCYTLWQGVRAEFVALCQAWGSVPQDGELIGQYRAHLCRLLELSADRCELYSVTESARREHAKCRESEMFEPQPQLEPIREFSKLETASIERAYRRL